VAAAGDTTRVSRIASISKLLATLTALVAFEEGTIGLDDPAGRPGATVRHLLAHASGYGFEEAEPVANVGVRRIYSNTGIEHLADYVATQAGMPFAQYQHEAVIAPLGMTHTELRGSPAYEVFSNVEDLVMLAREFLSPMLIDQSTLTEATTPQWPELKGVLPGFGSHDPNTWGLGFEIKANKAPHWTAPTNSPTTFGHFGGAGTFLWVDPDLKAAAVAISGTPFDTWAVEAWPATNAQIVQLLGPPS
jgi:CubicO group peptidase (beta-lactamase class C family)